MALSGQAPILASMAQYFVYIIESAKTQKWYYGATSDLYRRVEQHNKGWNQSTKGRGPWKLIFQREFESWESAREFEVQLKAWRNKDRLKRKFHMYFLRDTPTCPDAAKRSRV